VAAVAVMELGILGVLGAVAVWPGTADAKECTLTVLTTETREVKTVDWDQKGPPTAICASPTPRFTTRERNQENRAPRPGLRHNRPRREGPHDGGYGYIHSTGQGDQRTRPESLP
jgi:hypothetical protein